MKIVYVELKNIMGIKGLEFAPGKMTIIDGKNAAGKTSVLKGLQDAIGGGHDATLLAKGAEKGEIVLVFDDGMKLSKKIKERGSKVTLKDEKGKDIPRAASYLKEIVDDICVNPIKILTASKKDRVQQLLDSVPMSIPFDEIEAVTDSKLDRSDKRHPMEVIAQERSSVYESRQDNNRYLKEKQGQISQMREALPFKDDETDFDGQIKSAESRKQEIEAKVEAVRNDGQEYLNNQLTTLEQNKTEAIAKIMKQYEDDVHKLNQEFRNEVEEAHTENASELENLTAKIAQLKTSKEECDRTTGARQFVKDGDKEIEMMHEESEAMTAVINGLDMIRANLLENLPIDGMEVKDGDIYLDGVPFDRVNTAKRVQFALTIAGMRSAELPIVCVDNLESLDDESFAIFQEQAAKTDMQFFVTRVSDNPELNVDTDE